MYSLEDLDNAKTELKQWLDRFDSYSRNNPYKYQADIRGARSKIRFIEKSLKADGKIELTDYDRLENELNRAFPGAQSKDIVDYNGKQYKLRYFPLEKSRSRKTVKDWGCKWVKIK